MIARFGDTEQTLDLPPGYTLVALRELGDAFDRACEIAAKAGAGTLVWVRRYDLVEFAVVLEPDEPLRSARRAFFAGMNALADAIAAHCPPEREVSFDWPDAIRFDAGLLGGGRLGWPAECTEDLFPKAPARPVRLVILYALVFAFLAIATAAVVVAAGGTIVALFSGSGIGWIPPLEFLCRLVRALPPTLGLVMSLLALAGLIRWCREAGTNARLEPEGTTLKTLLLRQARAALWTVVILGVLVAIAL